MVSAPRPNVCAALVIPLALLLGAACDERRPRGASSTPLPAPADAAPFCEPGETQPCLCAGARSGAQSCAEDGRRWDPCDCGPPAGPVDAGGGDARGRADAGPRDAETPRDAEAPRDAGRGDADAPDAGRDPARDAADTGADAEPADVRPGDVGGPGGGDADAAPPPASARLGEDCERAADCLTDVCLGLTIAGQQHNVCATPCCHEEECPAGFGCLQAGAGRVCLPARIFPPGYSFDARTGEDCGPADGACKSGICDLAAGFCRGTCCTDRDCLAAPCHWSPAGRSLRTFCDPLALLNGDGRTGLPCASQDDCRSGVCAASGEPLAFQCADLCCGPADCPAGTACGLVASPEGSVVRACATLPLGPGQDGSACADDGESCTGGHCIEGACRRLCCLDTDCPAGWRCLPRTTAEGVLAPVCVDPAAP